MENTLATWQFADAIVHFMHGDELQYLNYESIKVGLKVDVQNTKVIIRNPMRKSLQFASRP